MSALGWGVALGGAVASYSYVSKVWPKHLGAALMASVGAGFAFGAIPYPDGVGLPAFFGMVIGIPLALFVFGRGKFEAARVRNQQIIAEREEQRRVREEKATCNLKAKASYLDSIRTDWPTQADCRFDQRDAIFVMRKDCRELGLIRYTMEDDFRPIDMFSIPTKSVFSARVKWRDVEKKVYRTQLVQVAARHSRSPVMRGLVGGFLAGPAGLILGAASGLGGRTTIDTVERQVPDVEIVKGDPSLVLGTTLDGLESVEIFFAHDSWPEYCLGQIRAAKARLRQPLTS